MQIVSNFNYKSNEIVNIERGRDYDDIGIKSESTRNLRCNVMSR